MLTGVESAALSEFLREFLHRNAHADLRKFVRANCCGTGISGYVQGVGLQNVYFARFAFTRNFLCKRDDFLPLKITV